MTCRNCVYCCMGRCYADPEAEEPPYVEPEGHCEGYRDDRTEEATGLE